MPRLRVGGTQYVLPKVVVFRAFFGMHTRLIDALLGGQWPRSASTLICTDHFASGLETAVGAETGAWKIVLQMGVPKWMAAPHAFPSVRGLHRLTGPGGVVGVVIAFAIFAALTVGLAGLDLHLINGPEVFTVGA